MTIKKLAKFLIDGGTQFQSEDGYFDREYITYRWDLSNSQWTELITEISWLLQGRN